MTSPRDRRDFLKVVGGGILGLLVGTAAGYFAAPRSPSTGDKTVTLTSTVTMQGTAISTTTNTITNTETKTIIQSPLPEEIKIGVLMPLSGPLAGPGKGMAQAAQLAAKLINNSGGIGGRNIRLLIEDVSVDPKMASDAAQKLVELDGVQVIVGPPTSQQVLTIAPYINSRQVVVISPSATSPAITKLGNDFVFRTALSDTLQAKAIAALITKMDYKRVAIFARNDAAGRGLTEDLQQFLRDRVIPNGVVNYESAKSDYTSELQQIKSASPDVVFYHAFVADGIVAYKQALTLGLDEIPSIGSQEQRDPTFFNDPLVAEFFARSKMMGVTPIQRGSESIYSRFIEQYKKEYGDAPGLFTTQTYDAVMLAALAIAKAGAYEGSKIKEALETISLSYTGPTGYLAFDENGDIAEATYQIWRAVRIAEGQYEFRVIGSYDPSLGVNISGE